MHKQPNFFQVGQPKCGTCALHDFLDQHPDIFMTRRKEPLYFSTDLRAEADAASRHFQYKFDIRTEADFLALFQDAGDAAIQGESTTHYLCSKTAAQEIRRFNPDARILISLRHPVDFLYSYHGQLLVNQVETETDFETALTLERSRRKGKAVPPTAYCPSFLLYSERVCYAEQLQRYLDCFPPEQILILIYEDFRDDNLTSFRRILEFLEVDPDFSPQSKEINLTRQPRSNGLARFVFNPRIRGSISRLVPRSVLQSEKLRRLAQSILWHEKKRPPLSPELRRNLMRQFRPEVEKVADLLGMDLLKRWKFDLEPSKGRAD
ncbi:sulfotransferase [bacterium]|nr:sulfotransferase [bacterium]